MNSVSTASKLVSVLTATDLGIDNSWYNAKSHSIIAYNNIFVTLYLPWLHCLSYKLGDVVKLLNNPNKKFSGVDGNFYFKNNMIERDLNILKIDNGNSVVIY